VAARLLGLLIFLGWGLAALAADPALLDELRKGGYVLYLRHASTDFSKDDSRMASFEDCAHQRPLTDKGRDEARAIGSHIKHLRIPIDKVYASPFCRTVETAMLAFGKAEKTQEVRGGPVRSDDPKRYDALKQLLAAPPPATATRSSPCSARPISPRGKWRSSSRKAPATRSPAASGSRTGRP
jgi:hypothetical protein